MRSAVQVVTSSVARRAAFDADISKSKCLEHMRHSFSLSCLSFSDEDGNLSGDEGYHLRLREGIAAGRRTERPHAPTQAPMSGCEGMASVVSTYHAGCGRVGKGVARRS